MSGFQQMIAIPIEQYNQLTQLQQVHKPAEQHKLMQLSQTYDQQALVKDPNDRLMLQGGTLEEMKDLKEKMRLGIELGTPRPYRNRALTLYRSLEAHVPITTRGELVDDVSGEPITDSRVEDLIQHAVRDRRRDFTPTAWSTFVSLLKKHNVPRTVLNRATLDELASPSVKTPVINTPFKTPNPRKRPRSLSPASSEKKSRKSERLRRKTSNYIAPFKAFSSVPPKKPRKSERVRRRSNRYPSPLFLKDFSP